MSRQRGAEPSLSVCKLPGGCHRAVLCAPVCAEHPDPSGPHPDTARTDPDTTQHHTADQPGHDPDDVRTEADHAPDADLDDEGMRLRVFGIALDNLIRFKGSSLHPSTVAVDLADAVLAVRDGEMQQLRDQLAQVEDLLRIAHDTSNRSEAERAQAVQRAEEAEADTRRLRELVDRLGTTEHQQRAVIARVREQCAEWARPIKSASWDAQIRDDIAASCAEMILRALDTPAVDQPAVDHEHVVQATTKQPVSDPQPLDESDPDTCHVVHIDGEPVRIHGQSDMTPETAGYFAEVVRAAKRKHAAEHPDSAAHSVAPTTTKDSPVTRYDELSDDARNLMAGFDELDIAEIAADTQRSTTRLRNHLAKAETERDGAYRERAQLVALLAAMTAGAVIAPAPDVDEPGWQIAYLTIGGRQATWHISPRDADLFAHIEHAPAEDPRAQWDGHTTEQKYDRIAAVTAELAQRCGPECAEGHTYIGRCESATTTTKEN